MRRPVFSRNKRSGVLESAPASFQEASCSVFKNHVNHHVDNSLKLVLGEYFHHENGETLQTLPENWFTCIPLDRGTVYLMVLDLLWPFKGDSDSDV